jgi:hypothetical protein
MPGRELDATERRAARTVASVLGGQAVPHDTEGAPEGSYDFTVELSDGRLIALEITTPEDGAVRALTKAALARRWPAPGLAGSWWLAVPTASQPSIKRIAKHAPQSLAELELHEVNQVDTHSPLIDQTNTQAVIDASRRLFALGVSRATALREEDDAQIMFSVTGGASGDSEQINALVEEHSGYNIDKLARATNVVERHLFISIPLSQSGAELAMATLPPPSAPPALPNNLDVVWVANWNERRLWRLTAGSNWEVLKVPDGE